MIAIEKKELFIVDDFYDNPTEIRNIALNAKYLPFTNGKVPGFESAMPFYAEEHITRFKELTEKDISINPAKYVFGKFRYMLEESDSVTSMHIDSPIWSAIVYLSKDEDCKGGLGIYKHKETNLEYVPETTEEINKLGFGSRMEIDAKVVRPDTKNLDAWEMMEFIPLKFNRMVLFKGSKYFHSVTEKFGNSIENARLTHNFFFN